MFMIVNERITTYLHSLETERDSFLEEMRSFAEETGVPIIRREMESFIRLLLSVTCPGQILEIGAGIAFSAIFMAKNSKAKITTIENYEKRIVLAEKYIARAGLAERIQLYKQDAALVLPRLQGPYDMIFLDAAKAQYIELLPDIERLVKKGGIFLADNVLQEGELIESRFSVERRQRTIHERMREFLWEVKHSDVWETSIITIGDGVSLSIKK